MWIWKLNHKIVWVQKNWCFRIVVLEKTLESPFNWKEIKPANPKKKTNLEYSVLEGLMLKLKLQSFGQLMWRADSLEKTPVLGKTEGKRRRGQRKMRWLGSITNSMDMNPSKLWREWSGKPECYIPWGHRVGHDLGDWITVIYKQGCLYFVLFFGLL